MLLTSWNLHNCVASRKVPHPTSAHTAFYSMLPHMRFPIWVTVLCKQMGRNTLKRWTPPNNLKLIEASEERKQSQLSEAFCLPSSENHSASGNTQKRIKIWATLVYLFICIPIESPTTSTKLQRPRDEHLARMWGERERKTLSKAGPQPGHAGSQASGYPCLTPRLRFQTV